MAAATTSQVVRRTWRERVGARLRNDYEEDGVFRPVRLSIWVDWGIAAAIIVTVVSAYAAFIYWLALTQ